MILGYEYEAMAQVLVCFCEDIKRRHRHDLGLQNYSSLSDKELDTVVTTIVRVSIACKCDLHGWIKDNTRPI